MFPLLHIVASFMRDTMPGLPIQQRTELTIITLIRNCIVGYAAQSYVSEICISSFSAVAPLGTARLADHDGPSESIA